MIATRDLWLTTIQSSLGSMKRKPVLKVNSTYHLLQQARELDFAFCYVSRWCSKNEAQGGEKRFVCWFGAFNLGEYSYLFTERNTEHCSILDYLEAWDTVVPWLWKGSLMAWWIVWMGLQSISMGSKTMWWKQSAQCISKCLTWSVVLCSCWGQAVLWGFTGCYWRMRHRWAPWGQSGWGGSSFDVNRNREGVGLFSLGEISRGSSKLVWSKSRRYALEGIQRRGRGVYSTSIGRNWAGTASFSL